MTKILSPAGDFSVDPYEVNDALTALLSSKNLSMSDDDLNDLTHEVVDRILTKARVL